MKPLKLECDLNFVDGATAHALLELTLTRIKLTTTVSGTPNIEVWDRGHVSGLKVLNKRAGEWFPTLVMKDGKEITLGFVMPETSAKALSSAF